MQSQLSNDFSKLLRNGINLKTSLAGNGQCKNSPIEISLIFSLAYLGVNNKCWLFTQTTGFLFGPRVL